MLQIFDFNGNDLVATPPSAVTVLATPSAGAKYTVEVVIEENDTTLPYDFVNGTVSWNDGSLPMVFFGTGTLTIDSSRSLQPGQYFVNVLATNFRAPLPNEVSVNFSVTVLPNVQQAPPANVLIGPILPKDDGFPNANDWDFTTSTDIDILASSLKMLLLTNKGERVMNPDYGTTLRQIIFQQNVSGIESMVQQAIVDAITTWEPRVSLLTVSVVSNDDSSVTVNAAFVSKITQTGFTTVLVFQP